MKRAVPLLLVAATAHAAGPKKLDVLKLLRQTLPATKSVSDILEDLGGGRFPVLFVTGGKDCQERKIDGQVEKNCSATTSPHVAVVRRGADGVLSLEGQLDLPLQAAPWDQPEEMKWGIHFIKDYDLDGKPELMLAYGYHGPTLWAVGDIWYKHWCILNLDPLGLAIHVVLDETPQASSFQQVESKWKLVGPKGAPPSVQITRRTGDYDDKKGERSFQERTVTYGYDPKQDQWIEAK